ncbi:hypothetical protein [Blautia sp. MSJ-9]|uniref:hypothetical protein n=1 Tax=Blautia sp. MSJ-9 TaxID=2841511 RepID=UPI001C1073A7|nr:hypothetical protein [Blautia sp. MSJ-9]MBU5682055.1 hypothetical protein [Blautia sp. MSJ-9]
MVNDSNDETTAKAVCVSRKELPKLLGCGQYTADKIARRAGARIEIGRRVLIYLPKLDKYFANMTDMD